MFKISVIIPIYNAGVMLNECLYSVVNQQIGMENIQVICINDRSPLEEQEMEIQKFWHSKFPNNFVILKNHENMGQGASRNKAILYIKGEYVHFLDSDDTILPNLYLDAYQQLQKQQARVFRFNYYRKPLEKLKRQMGWASKEGVMNNTDKTRALFYSYAWMSIFHSKLLANMKPFPNTIYEDMVTMPSLLKTQGKCIQTNKVYYYYRINPFSTTQKALEQIKLRDNIKLHYLQNTLTEFIENDYFPLEYGNMLALFLLLYMISYNTDTLQSFKSKLRLMKNWKKIGEQKKKTIKIRLSMDMIKDYGYSVACVHFFIIFFWNIGFFEFLFFVKKGIRWYRQFIKK